MKNILVLFVICIISCGSNNNFKNINSCLDTLIGMPKETIVKSFGTPSHITTQYVEVAVAENDRYYAHSYTKNVETVYTYEITYSSDKVPVVFSSAFPEGISILVPDNGNGYYKIEFYLKNNRVESWIGFKEKKR